MGFASFLEDISLRATEAWGVATGAYPLATSAQNPPGMSSGSITECQCAFCRPRPHISRPSIKADDGQRLIGRPSPNRHRTPSAAPPPPAPRRPSPFLKQLYASLRDKCLKFAAYVVAKSKSGDWPELAHKFDWHCAAVDDFKKKDHGKISAYLDQLAKPMLDEIAELSQAIDNIVHDLDVFVSTVDRTAEILLNNKDAEAVEVLDAEDFRTEQEAAWLLHRWIKTKEEIKELNRQIAEAREQFDDFVFEHAMTQAVRQVKDKDA